VTEKHDDQHDQRIHAGIVKVVIGVADFEPHALARPSGNSDATTPMMEKATASLAPLSSQGGGRRQSNEPTPFPTRSCAASGPACATHGAPDRGPSNVENDHRDHALHEADDDRRQAGQAKRSRSGSG